MNKIFTTKFFAIALTVLISGFGLQAQDIHFSQYESFTGAHNPALTGNFDGSYRLAAIYRNQWGSVLAKDGFQTPGAMIDLPLFEGQLKHDRFGIGVMVYNDISGQSSLHELNAGLSLAYHKGIGKEGKHRLSLGAQAAFMQKRLDPIELTFYDQFDVISHSGSGSTQENLASSSFHNFDFNVGLYWRSFISERFSFNAGLGVFHLAEPSEVLGEQNNSEFVLPRRYSADLGLDIGVTDKLYLTPTFLYMNQDPFAEYTFGTMIDYRFHSGFRDRSSVGFGARYRWDDAVIAMARIEFRNLALGFAYDVNISDLDASTNGKGGFEFSVVYTGESIKAFKADKSVPSRRF